MLITRRTSLFIYFLSCPLLLMVITLSSTHADLEEINALLKEQRYSEAVTQLQNLVKSSKDVETRSRGYYQLGEIYYNYTQQYPEALKSYERILSMQDNGVPMAEIFLAYIKIGDVYSRIGNYDRAIQYLQALVSTAPETHFVQDIGSQKIRDIQTALKDLKGQQEIIRTYKGTPLEGDAQFQIAELYRAHSQLNQPEKAIETYQQLLAKHPKHKLAAEAQWRIAHLRHTVLHQSTLAIDAYKKVVDKFPTSNFAAEALFHIANLHREDQKYQQALTVYQTLTDNYPNFWNMHAVLYWSGICHENIKNYVEAHKAFLIFLNVYLPALDPVYLGQIAMYDKTADEVRQLIRAKIDRLTQLIPEQQFETFQVAVKNEDWTKALTIGLDLIVSAPGTDFVKRVAIQIHSIKHRAAIQKLLAEIKNGQLNLAEKARTQLQIGTIYERKLLDYSKAVDAYKKMVQEQPKSSYSAEARYRIGIISVDILEKPNTALQYFNAVIKHHPNTLQAMMATYQVGEIYSKLQRWTEAVQAYQTTIAYPERELYLSGGYKDSYADRAQFRIGRAHFEDQRFNDARFAFEEFIKNRPESPRFAAAHIYLAVMHQQNSEIDTAIGYYKKAEKLLIDSPVQLQTVIDEAGTLGFQSPDAVLKVLQDRQKRLKSE